MIVHPVILCGGAGSRLWPLSRALLPKQFLPLISERTLLQETVSRVRDENEFAAPIVVSNQEHRFMVAEQLRELGVLPASLVIEPVGRNTAPAVAAAALSLADADRNAVMLVLPSDHLIVDVAAFRSAIRTAAGLAADGKLVTFGIRPTEPAVGYGYIRRGAAIAVADHAFEVAEFVEKPDLETAKKFLTAGDYDWNSGMFVFSAGRYLDELQKFRPDILEATRLALQKGIKDLDFQRLDETEFARCPSESVDYALMERTRNACVVSVKFGWSDIGSWSALWEVGAKDANGNIVRGDVYTDRVENSYVRAESRLVAAVGVKDLVIVETDDAVLVAHKDHAQDVKQTVEHLRSSSREEHVSHSRVYRPWGYYEAIDAGEHYQAKRLMVKPGEALSLQRHQHRAEHWVVVLGTARVTRGEEVITLEENQSTYISPGVKHRLENAASIPLYVIEVQSGSYLGEDDIERFEDRYGRGGSAPR